MLSRCPGGLTPSASASWRRSFIVGFAEEVGRRLESDRAAAAAEHDAATAGASAGTAAAGGGASSTALVLASRADDVDDELRRRHPRLRSSWASSGRSASGRREGRAAGREASISRRGLGGRGRLGPGGR
jgi:hypothetical protein